MKVVVVVLDAVAVAVADVHVQLSPIAGAGSRVLQEVLWASCCNFHPQDQGNQRDLGTT